MCPFHELKFDLHNMIVIHEMDIHFIKNTITLSGCDIYRAYKSVHLQFFFIFKI